MKKSIKIGIFLMALATIIGCRDEFPAYLHDDTEESVDLDLMELLEKKDEYSDFLKLLKSVTTDSTGVDTLFSKGNSLTLFVPTNEAMASFGDVKSDTASFVRFLISETYINVAQLKGQKRVLTSGNKYAILHAENSAFYFESAKITGSSPLCKNGKYYEISELVEPHLNMYEYITRVNPLFKKYIDSRDSTFLNLELSKPMGYDEKGNTIYDSVFTTVNLFENQYYPVSKEFRTKKASMFLFTQEQYNEALSKVAEDLGIGSYQDVPDGWRNEVLMPYLLDQGVFWDELSALDFLARRLKNIKGDSVYFDINTINTAEPVKCSNGLIINYSDFSIPDSLYLNDFHIQGEYFALGKGSERYVWKDFIKVEGVDKNTIDVVVKKYLEAENDSALLINFNTSDYMEEYAFTFPLENVFPGKYRLLIRAKSNEPSGVFQILINGVPQQFNIDGAGFTDKIDLYNIRDRVLSISGNELFKSNKYGFNNFDMIHNIEEFGQVDVTIKYIAPGQRSSNGIAIDYIKLIRVVD